MLHLRQTEPRGGGGGKINETESNRRIHFSTIFRQEAWARRSLMREGNNRGNAIHTHTLTGLTTCGVVRFSPGCPWGNGRILSLSHDLPAC